MKTYTNSEAIKILEENSLLEFECVQNRKSYKLFCDKNEIRLTNDRGIDCGFKIGDKWTLVQRPIYFMDAIKEYSKGKTIICKIGDEKYTYIPQHVEENSTCYNELFSEEYQSSSITSYEILNGKWYIEEE